MMCKFFLILAAPKERGTHSSCLKLAPTTNAHKVLTIVTNILGFSRVVPRPRGSGRQQVVKSSRVDSGWVRRCSKCRGSCHEVLEPHGSGWVSVFRPDPRELTRPVKTPANILLREFLAPALLSLFTTRRNRNTSAGWACISARAERDRKGTQHCDYVY